MGKVWARYKKGTISKSQVKEVSTERVIFLKSDSVHVRVLNINLTSIGIRLRWNTMPEEAGQWGVLLRCWLCE